jgi:hypothetical protein
MVERRQGQVATMLSDGRVLIAAGGAGGPAEIFSPETGTFSKTGSMAALHSLGTATLLADGRVLIAGGADGTSDTASAELYDSTAGTFSATSSMATASQGETATLLADGRVLVAGGEDSNSGDLASAELYQP